ncbi:GspE/PulE family protein [Caldimonas tepidiphila]|uniref:GspE/PulE family protein n=1 Tax=Caldimonas tepidiphila TaxID=2315841 RepID=UPI00196B82C2|nr:ATPase, T2SS/T4P/T4SS family [Caldimonas tepidiphila]
MSDTFPPPLPEAEAAAPTLHWPAPPLGGPHADDDLRALLCEIAGHNGRQMRGRLVRFSPADELVLVQVPPARIPLTIRFAQFRSLALGEPLIARGEPPEPLPASRYEVTMKAGEALAGQTLGHVETPSGLFLFPPAGPGGAVTRLFVPVGSYERFVVDAPAAGLPVSHRIRTPAALITALEQQSRMPVVRLGEALLSLGMIEPEALAEALERQKTRRDVPLGALLVQQGRVSPQDLQAALAHKMGYPMVEAEHFPADSEAVRLLPYAVATRLNALPLLLREDGRLVVALEDPSRRDAIEELEFVTQSKVVPVLAQADALAGAIREHFERLGADVGGAEFEASDTGKLIETLERDSAGGAGDDEDRQIEQSDNSLVRLINNMIIEAHSRRVSDIHIECYPGRDKVKVRFRRDGVMQPYLELPYNYRTALVARIKVMCELDISERRKPQDGKISFGKFVPGYKLELRVATVPTHGGLEDVVLRLLSSARPVALDQLGLSPENHARLREAIERPYGMVLCVGPTGSGKTTTLHSALGHLNRPERKIWTAEDPVEITQPGLRQVQINPRIEWTFAKALRAFLRADPDVIMVGEIRDEETAHIAVEAALTGHLMLSTLHTNSAADTVTRLLDMGVDPFNFADSLLAILAQRLVRRLCAHCRQSRAATPEEVDELLADWLHAWPDEETRPGAAALRQAWLERFGRDGRLQLHHSPGCEKCEHLGFNGRAGLHELMLVSRELRQLIHTGARPEELLRQAMREGMRTLRQDGIEKVLQGVTTLAEVRATSNA